MSKFKVGDRVRCYFFFNQCTGTVQGDEDGKIIFQREDDLGGFYRVWPQACRKLVRKPRRRIWVNEYPEDILCAYVNKEIAAESADSNRISCTEFVEVRRGKR